MKKALFIMAFLMVCGVAQAQCDAKNIDVEIDPIYGSVKITTQYTINEQPVDVGGVPCDNCSQTSGRYDESQGTLEEILLLNESNRNEHCDNLMKRRLSNEQREQIAKDKMEQKKLKNEVLKKEFEKTINTSIEKTEVIEIYKGMEIKIDADKKVTITGKLSVDSK